MSKKEKLMEQKDTLTKFNEKSLEIIRQNIKSKKIHFSKDCRYYPQENYVNKSFFVAERSITYHCKYGNACKDGLLKLQEEYENSKSMIDYENNIEAMVDGCVEIVDDSIGSKIDALEEKVDLLQQTMNRILNILEPPKQCDASYVSGNNDNDIKTDSENESESVEFN